MGNTCCNEAQKKDNHAKDFKVSGGLPETRDAKLDKLLEDAKEKEKEVLKIQSVFRG